MSDSKAAKPEFIPILVPACDRPPYDVPADRPAPRTSLSEPLAEHVIQEIKLRPQTAPAGLPSLDERRRKRSGEGAELPNQFAPAPTLDLSPMDQAVGRLKTANIKFTRPSKHQLKIGKINYYPDNGRIYVDGAARSEAGRFTLEMALDFIREALLDRSKVKIQ